MSDKDNINREYLETIMTAIESQQHLLPIENRMDDKFLSILREKLELAINDSMILYLTNHKDSYELNEEEIDRCYESAGMEYTDSMVNDLVDNGYLQATIDEKGNVLYGLTEKTKDYLDQNKINLD